jgi:hypothetical protein
VSGDRVDGLDLAAEPFRCACVEQGAHRGRLLRRQRPTGPGVQIVMADRDVTGRRLDDLLIEDAAGRLPRGQAAVEDAHIGNAGRGQHPPGARRSGAKPVVVHDDRHTVTHTPAPRGRLDASPGRQRMATACGDAVVGQVVLERHMHRTGNVPARVRGPAIRPGQLPAHVQHRRGFAGRQALR